MDNIVCKVEALGGTISTTDIPHMAEYRRLLRAKERGDLIKLRQGHLCCSGSPAEYNDRCGADCP